jgi:hypothetical protein
MAHGDSGQSGLRPGSWRFWPAPLQPLVLEMPISAPLRRLGKSGCARESRRSRLGTGPFESQSTTGAKVAQTSVCAFGEKTGLFQGRLYLCPADLPVSGSR